MNGPDDCAGRRLVDRLRGQGDRCRGVVGIGHANIEGLADAGSRPASVAVTITGIDCLGLMVEGNARSAV